MRRTSLISNRLQSPPCLANRSRTIHSYWLLLLLLLLPLLLLPLSLCILLLLLLLLLVLLLLLLLLLLLRRNLDGFRRGRRLVAQY
jgi:hypothetical protein